MCREDVSCPITLFSLTILGTLKTVTSAVTFNDMHEQVKIGVTTSKCWPGRYLRPMRSLFVARVLVKNFVIAQRDLRDVDFVAIVMKEAILMNWQYSIHGISLLSLYRWRMMWRECHCDKWLVPPAFIEKLIDEKLSDKIAQFSSYALRAFQTLSPFKYSYNDDHTTEMCRWRLLLYLSDPDLRDIGVEAGIFWGCKGYLLQIAPIVPEKLLWEKLPSTKLLQLLWLLTNSHN